VHTRALGITEALEFSSGYLIDVQQMSMQIHRSQEAADWMGRCSGLVSTVTSRPNICLRSFRRVRNSPNHLHDPSRLCRVLERVEGADLTKPQSFSGALWPSDSDAEGVALSLTSGATRRFAWPTHGQHQRTLKSGAFTSHGRLVKG
jgi:hypothetical protein